MRQETVVDGDRSGSLHTKAKTKTAAIKPEGDTMGARSRRRSMGWNNVIVKYINQDSETFHLAQGEDIRQVLKRVLWQVYWSCSWSWAIPLLVLLSL